MPVDPVELTRALIRCPSVTPDDAGTFEFLEQALSPVGFECQYLTFGSPGTSDVSNFYARWGERAPHFAFAGHVDVVPPGKSESWLHDPFSAHIDENGAIFGRGAADMKSGLAAAVAAACRLAGEGSGRGSISFLVTADEEGPAKNGTAKLLEWTAEKRILFDGCIVGEPTSRDILGDMVKIGRRGSLNVTLTAKGKQGHVAYPKHAENAAHRIVKMLQLLIEGTLDRGSDCFDPSSLQVTSIDIGNPAGNVVPETATARFNIRFGDVQAPESLRSWIIDKLDAAGGEYEVSFDLSGVAFRTDDDRLVPKLVESIQHVLGRTPELSTSGGTSDARFIHSYMPVIEFGMVGRTMHQVNEQVAQQDIRLLADVYYDFLNRFFAT